MNYNDIKNNYLSEIEDWISDRKLYGEKDCLDAAWIRFNNQVNWGPSFDDKLYNYFSNEQKQELIKIIKLIVHIKEQVRIYNLFMEGRDDPLRCPKMLFSVDTLGWNSYRQLKDTIKVYIRLYKDGKHEYDTKYNNSVKELQKRIIAYRYYCLTIWR